MHSKILKISLAAVLVSGTLIADGYTMTPDGKYVPGESFTMAPDGSFIGK